MIKPELLRNPMIEISPLEAPLDAVVSVPGSKSLTQRALIAAALAEGQSTLMGPLASEDTHYTMTALRQIGVRIDDSDPLTWIIQGCGGRIQCPHQDIFLGNNGTATRFLTSLVALGQGGFRISGSERMAQRPIAPLMAALQGWGGELTSEAGNGCPPLRIEAKGLAGGSTTLPEGKSSQYLSSLLLVAPYTQEPAELHVQGTVLSRPYVEMTLAVMADFGIQVEAASELNHFCIPQGCYSGRDYAVEGDASGASYFWAAAAVTGGKVRVANVPDPSLQGDAGLVPLLARMGCTVSKAEGGICVQGPEYLRALEVDMGNMPDVAPTLAVVAAFAHGTSVINNIEHLRIKECDRLAVMVQNLQKIGAVVEEEADRMIIHGKGKAGLHGAEIPTFEDHRMAMCFAVAGLCIPGIKIHGEDCVAKSFPDFWQRFAQLSL